jgi:hypothetical protein
MFFHIIALKALLDRLSFGWLCVSPSEERPKGSLSKLCPLPPCGIIRLPNRGRGEELFS